MASRLTAKLIGEGYSKPNAENELPIDINYAKLSEWLVSSRTMDGTHREEEQGWGPKGGLRAACGSLLLCDTVNKCRELPRVSIIRASFCRRNQRTCWCRCHWRRCMLCRRHFLCAFPSCIRARPCLACRFHRWTASRCLPTIIASCRPSRPRRQRQFGSSPPASWGSLRVRHPQHWTAQTPPHQGCVVLLRI